MNDMEIEVNKKRKGYTKATFALDMNCDIALINFIDDLTMLFRKDYPAETDSFLIGNKNQKYCGRSYFDKNQLWVGRYFDSDNDNLKNRLMVGFLVCDAVSKNKSKEIQFEENYIKNVATVNNYETEYVKDDEGTWHYILMDDILKMSIPKAYKKISKVIWKVVKYSFQQ